MIQTRTTLTKITVTVAADDLALAASRRFPSRYRLV